MPKAITQRISMLESFRCFYAINFEPHNLRSSYPFSLIIRSPSPVALPSPAAHVPVSKRTDLFLRNFFTSVGRFFTNDFYDYTGWSSDRGQPAQCRRCGRPAEMCVRSLNNDKEKLQRSLRPSQLWPSQPLSKNSNAFCVQYSYITTRRRNASDLLCAYSLAFICGVTLRSLRSSIKRQSTGKSWESDGRESRARVKRESRARESSPLRIVTFDVTAFRHTPRAVEPNCSRERERQSGVERDCGCSKPVVNCHGERESVAVDKKNGGQYFQIWPRRGRTATSTHPLGHTAAFSATFAQ